MFYLPGELLSPGLVSYLLLFEYLLTQKSAVLYETDNDWSGDLCISTIKPKSFDMWPQQASARNSRALLVCPQCNYGSGNPDYNLLILKGLMGQ